MNLFITPKANSSSAGPGNLNLIWQSPISLVVYTPLPKMEPMSIYMSFNPWLSNIGHMLSF